MQLLVQGQDLEFAYDDDHEQYAAAYKLPLWADFHSENSREGQTGAQVILTLESESVEHQHAFSDAAHYAKAINWFLTHQPEILAAALDALHDYIDVLRDEYEIDDDELNTYTHAAQLAHMVDISFVRFYPQSKAGLPYFALELECNWNPDGGCGIMFYGSDVVDIGDSDTAQGAFDIDEDGGEIA
jgi:hypothetical protein